MRTDDTPSVTLTWRQFDEVLTRLGYQRHQTANEQIYEEPTTGTLLIFPLRSQSERVERQHLYMARMNTALKGVAEESRFDSAIYPLLEPTRELVAA